MSVLPLVKGLLLCVVLDAVLSLEKELDFVEKWRGDDGRRFSGEHQVGSGSVAIIKIDLEVGPKALIWDLSFIHSPPTGTSPKVESFLERFPYLPGQSFVEKVTGETTECCSDST